MGSPYDYIYKPQKRKQIILINGPMRSGKDHIASLLTSLFEDDELTVESISFAGPIKQILATTFGITLEQLDEYKNNSDIFNVNVEQKISDEYREDVCTTNFRTILQQFGTEAMKPIFGDSVWADLGYVRAVKSTADIILITDYRFDEELTEFTSHTNPNYDTTTVYIDNGAPVESPQFVHASEHKPSVPFDVTIDNSTKDNSVLPEVTLLVTHIREQYNGIM